MVLYDKRINKQTLFTRLMVLVLCLLLSPAWGAERTTYYHLDLLGSPVAASDPSGQVRWREEYKPYGERLLKPVASGGHTLWYTGKVHDDAVGLSYYGARWHDPELGRFTGIDPVDVQEDNVQSFNRYAYANNNPYKYVDPDGRAGVMAACAAGPWGCVFGAAVTLLAIEHGVSGTLEAVRNESGDGGKESGNSSASTGSAKDESRAKRRASREAQRKHGTPTSKSGKNQQGQPGTPRHQIKDGPDGEPDGIVDGSNDTVPGHGSHVEVGDLKAHDPINRHGQPRLRSGKSKVEF